MSVKLAYSIYQLTEIKTVVKTIFGAAVFNLVFLMFTTMATFVIFHMPIMWHDS